MVCIVYRPPDQSVFVYKLSNAINNTTNFDSQEVYILGDFNINLINTKTGITNGIRQYKQFCSLHGLKQLILNPTCITENTSTLLDHVLTNSHDKVSQSGVVDVGISDHQLTYCTRKISRTKSNEHKYITIRSLKHYTKDIFITALNSINFPDYAKYGNVDEAYEDLTKKLSEVIDNIAPLKKIRVRNNTQDGMMMKFDRLSKKRDKLFAIFKNTKLSDNNVKYKKARNHVQSIIKRKKRQFYVDKLKYNVGKPKELWKTLKSLGLSSNANIASKICLEKNDILSFDAKSNAETFKGFYSNLASDLVKKLPRATNIFGIDSVKKYYEKYNLEGKHFSFSNTTEQTVLKLLNNINPSKAAGLDNLSGKFLKEGSSVLAGPITKIINLSISLSSFPDECKHAKLKPLFKKGTTTNPKNYRPISLLPLISKIIEKIIHDQTQNFLDENRNPV